MEDFILRKSKDESVLKIDLEQEGKFLQWAKWVSTVSLPSCINHVGVMVRNASP